MEYQYFIKYGNAVRYTWRDYNYYAAICVGYGPIPYKEHSKIVTICGSPRDAETKRFVSLSGYFDDELTEILVKDEKGNKFYATLDQLSLYNEIEDLSFDELKSLREQISLGSIYLADYENTFGVDRDSVCEHADEYGKFIEWDEKKDTPENFAYFITEGRLAS